MSKPLGIGTLDDWGLTPDDDNFHPPTEDRWWTETAWFAWFVPERNLVGYFYPMFRPNIGVQAGGVIVYDDTAELPWELLFFQYDWHNEIPANLDLRDAQLTNGMTIKCLEPARKFQLGYEHKDLQLNFTVEAVTRPLVSAAKPPFNKGHIDQLCHVTGTMVLRGEQIAVDCIAMRDRSWGPRQDGHQPEVGYEYGCLDADNAFLAVAVSDKHGGYPVTTGFLIRNGVWSQLTEGTRSVERDAEGKPEVVHVHAFDQLGRQLVARGEVKSRQVFTAYPSMFCWNGLVEWQADGWTGWGEDQDCWHPRRWREYAARLRSDKISAAALDRL